ncbi:uncharacterized protein N7483_007330 [Penicillium malachiteum]|uniref:uncharacterized protein n=1 Tax=Penicillium malachiteum TaxID=1324776 RepID=UPI002549B3BF|nr:uncharacterized protein N7483_007330 [Penicillium malachiteum]KAJ5725973.1 hypothetical protein N7483_007330 [Penicillium malachiteum]
MDLRSRESVLRGVSNAMTYLIGKVTECNVTPDDTLKVLYCFGNLDKPKSGPGRSFPHTDVED